MKYVLGVVAVLLIALIGVLTLGGDRASSPQVPQEHMMSESDMRGIHIMPDGRVMSGGGVEIVGASIKADGTVTLPSGATVTPSADYRQK